MDKQTNWLDDISTSDSSTEKQISLGFPESMVILDCETTGGKSSYHRIIEVGLLVIENGKVVKQWQSLVNPETVLPVFITSITGIQEENLINAPVFADIADELLSLIEGKTLVAHNARFDYGFLRNEFSRVGIKYSSKLLCSVKLSRAMYPQFKSHSLDAIIKRFRFSIKNRHRAKDDAEMVWQLFKKTTEIFSEKDIEVACKQIIKTPTLPSKLDPSEIEKLPRSAGVYYFYDEQGVLLYVGKSVNIRSRVLNHFSQDHKNHKDLRMSARISHIDYDRTPSDFGAQLLESKQVKALKPLMNSRLRKQKKLYQLSLDLNQQGYLTPTIIAIETEVANQQSSAQFGLFRSHQQAKAQLEKVADQFFLCHQLLGLEPNNSRGSKPCFRYQLKRCFGACCNQETAEDYNERVDIAFKNYQTKAWPWESGIVVVEKEASAKSSEANEHYHLIDNWVYLSRLITQSEVQDYGYEFSPAFVLDSTGYQDIKNAFDREEPPEGFDLDMYFILIRFLFDSKKRTLGQLKIIKLHRL